jgi:hypothetical protein
VRMAGGPWGALTLVRRCSPRSAPSEGMNSGVPQQPAWRESGWAGTGQRIATPAGVPVVKSEEVRGTGKPACRPRKFPERAKMVGLANKIREPVREEGPGVVGNLAFRRVKKNSRQVNRNRKPDLFAVRVIVRVTSTTSTTTILLLLY